MRVTYKAAPPLWREIDAFTAAHRAVLNQPTRRPSPLINDDEVDLVVQILGIPSFVKDFMSGKGDALTWLAHYSQLRNFPSLVMSEDLCGAAFLERLSQVMRFDVHSSYDGLCLAQNLWWASSVRCFYADCLIDSVLSHLTTEHRAIAFSAAANFASNSAADARALLDRSIVSSLVDYFEAHSQTHSEARNPLRLILSLYQKLDAVDFTRLAPVAPHFIAYVSDRWFECRPLATYCALAMFTSDVDADVAAVAVEALVNAQLLFIEEQVEPLAKTFRLVVARGLYDLVNKADFFDGLTQTLNNADHIEDDVFRCVAGVVCDIMDVDGDALVAAGILKKVVAICDTGRGVIRVIAAAIIAHAIVTSPVDVCAAVVEIGGLAAVLGVVGSARPPDVGVMLQAIARVVRDGGEWREIIRESDFWNIKEEVDTEDQECLELIDTILQELDA
jgi:hypothetical protein